MSQEQIEKAGELLAVELRKQSPLRYSHFYNESTSEQLQSGDMAVAIDCAVFQLVDHKLVKRRELPDLLIDENPDYEIAVTELGRNWLSGGIVPLFAAEDL